MKDSIAGLKDLYKRGQELMKKCDTCPDKPNCKEQHKLIEGLQKLQLQISLETNLISVIEVLAQDPDLELVDIEIMEEE